MSSDGLLEVTKALENPKHRKHLVRHLKTGQQVITSLFKYAAPFLLTYDGLFRIDATGLHLVSEKAFEYILSETVFGTIVDGAIDTYELVASKTIAGLKYASNAYRGIHRSDSGFDVIVSKTEAQAILHEYANQVPLAAFESFFPFVIAFAGPDRFNKAKDRFRNIRNQHELAQALQKVATVACNILWNPTVILEEFKRLKMNSGRLQNVRGIFLDIDQPDVDGVWLSKLLETRFQLRPQCTIRSASGNYHGFFKFDSGFEMPIPEAVELLKDVGEAVFQHGIYMDSCSLDFQQMFYLPEMPCFSKNFHFHAPKFLSLAESH